MKKIVSAFPPVMNGLSCEDLASSKVFESIVSAYGLLKDVSKDDQMGVKYRLVDKLHVALSSFEFNSPNVQASNLWEAIVQIDFPKDHRFMLLAVLACILDDHQKKATDGAGNSPKTEWDDSTPLSKLDLSHYWVANWAHALEELMNLVVFYSYLKCDFSQFGIVAVTSALTDSIKEPGPKGVLTHHIAAANFASEALKSALPVTDEQFSEITSGILSHQYSPPFIMALMAKILLSQKQVASEIITSIHQKLFSPFDHLLVSDSPIPHTSAVVLSEVELAALKQIHPDFRGWFLPKSGISERVVQVDSLQYFGLGLTKCVGLRGPGTGLQDLLLEDSVESVLGLDQEQSVGACDHQFRATDEERRFFDAMQVNAQKIKLLAFERLREQLAGDNDFMELNKQLPNIYQAVLVSSDSKSTLQHVVFLDVELPGEMKNGLPRYQTDAPQFELIMRAATMVRKAFVGLYYGEYSRRLQSGEFYLFLDRSHARGDLQPPSRRPSRSVSRLSDSGIPLGDLAAIGRQLSSDSIARGVNLTK